MSNPWASEFWRACAAFVVSIVIGLILGELFLTLFLGLGLYLAWHLYQLYQLEDWISRRDPGVPPDAGGVWDAIYHHIYRLQQRNRQRKVKLSKMLSRFNKSTSAMPDATVVINEYGEIDWFNKAASTYLGLKKKKDVGQRIDNLIRNPRLVKLLNSGDFEKVIEIQSPVNENMTLSIRLVPYAGNQLLMVVRDMTRLYQLEIVRRDFVANVSHELRTPLTVINGYLENLVENQDIPPEQMEKAIQQMSQQSLRMTRIVDDLLLLSRLESDERPDIEDFISVPAIIAAIQEELNPLANEKQQKLNADIDKQLWLKGSEKEIYSAFSNLVTNAIKYTPEKGEINIVWQRCDTQEGSGLNDGACFSVQDTGIGIAVSHIPRLTERFYRIDKGRSRDSGGTGLGLSIVKHVLNRHNANLKITSSPGRGSEFLCRFSAGNVVDKQQNENAEIKQVSETAS